MEVRSGAEADLVQEEEGKEVGGLNLGIEIFLHQVDMVEIVTILRLAPVPKEDIRDFRAIVTIQTIEFVNTFVLIWRL